MIRFDQVSAQNDWLENTIPCRLTGVDDSCRNLHANEEGPCTLSGEIEKMISRLSIIPKLDAIISSLDITIPIHQPTRRSPSGARRRVWQKKARYQRKRCPQRLRPWQIESLFEADYFARCIGWPLNAFLTISWKNTLHCGEDIPRRFQRATKAMGQWMRRRNCPATWVFVHENPGNSNPNCHFLMHVPPEELEAFREIVPDWFDALEGGVHVRARNGPGDRCLSYMVKGTDYITAHRYGAKARNQGIVDFKRCGWTENLGTSSRQRAFTKTQQA